MIKDDFIKSLGKYESNAQKQVQLWSEIEQHYSSSKRHYHNLTHLESLLAELFSFQNKFKDWDVVVFAIAYHDVIYNVLKSDNEEKSADFASKNLKSILFPDLLIKRCESFILATKKHENSDEEINLFTDADLSILGSQPDVYKKYTAQIRNEYKVYPDFIYNPGRKKVLAHFLNMERIFKTKEFSDRYEQQARTNLSEELKSLV